MQANASARHRRTALTVLAVAIAFGGAACGSLDADLKSTKGPAGATAEKPAEAFPGLSGPEIANRAVTATKAATSLTLDVTLKTADGPQKGYMAISKKGDCAGTLSVGSDGTAELIKTGSTAYLRFDEALLRSQNKGAPAEEQEAVLEMMKGRWIKTDASDAEARDSLELCDLNKLLADVEANDTAARRVGETTVGGRKAVKLTESDGKETYTMYVAAEGEPYLLKFEQVGGEEPGTMTFSGFDKPVPAKKPAAKDILDLDKLGKQ
ncbi:hypothetical protein OG317_15615 [Streptomyces sp. NBC_01167]|uniref:hypothetical protein n=1 Tax=Streptomyces sp. NBC_01167 TaxID=2903756 RepID=UPI00386799B7|nr:hypothetical protein OG317_15615 [Streptomyces sp. NBC_01167]